MFAAFWLGRVARVAMALVLAMALASCASTSGPTLQATVQSAGPPKGGMARVIVFRANEYAGLIDPGWPIMLDGKPVGELKTGTFAYVDRPAGRHQLSLDMGFAFPGTPVAKHGFSTAPGRTYYVMARINEKGQGLAAVGAMTGLVGYAVATAATSGDDRAPVDFVPVDQNSARDKLADLRLAEGG